MEEKDASISWKPVSFFYVEYPTGDPIGYLLAWCSLLPVLIVVGFIALLILRRDLHTICFFIGILCNEVTNMVLKKLINQKRPESHGRGYFPKSNGMPSDHSQLSWFFVSYLILFLFLRLLRNGNPIDLIWRYFLSCGTLCLAIMVSFSRVYLGYHTSSQVIWGALFGIAFGIIWFVVVQHFLTPCFPYLVYSRLGDFLMLRDCSLIPNVLWYEYLSIKTESRHRARKLSTVKH